VVRTPLEALGVGVQVYDAEGNPAA
jgi:hypothetical protein